MKNWRQLSVVQPESKLEWFVHVFVTWGVEEVVATRHDSGEKIETIRSEFTDVVDSIAEKSPIIRQFSSTSELIDYCQGLR